MATFWQGYYSDGNQMVFCLCTKLPRHRIEELWRERGIEVDHATINRWVIEFGPRLATAFKKRKAAVNGSWCMDETYIKIKGKWYYQYRAVDKYGATVDCLLCKHRDASAANRFFKKAIRSSGLLEKVTIDKSGSNIAALDLINEKLAPEKKIEVRQIKYLNNILEQDHRFIKKITKPMKGFKSFNAARATLAGIELHICSGKDSTLVRRRKQTFGISSTN